MIKFSLVIIGAVILIFIGARSNIFGKTEKSVNSNTPSLVNLSCPNNFTDKENRISFCLPINYIEIPQGKIAGFRTAFGPLQDRACVGSDGSYCDTHLLMYSVGTEEVPTSLYGAPVSLIDKNFSTDSGLKMNGYAFDKYRFGPIYILKISDNSFAYFHTVSSHPKAGASEHNIHLGILKSIKLL